MKLVGQLQGGQQAPGLVRGGRNLGSVQQLVDNRLKGFK
jgi:hypothetical protein